MIVVVQFAGLQYTQLNNLLFETVCRGGSVCILYFISMGQ